MKKTVKTAIAAITAAALLFAAAIPVVGWTVDRCESFSTCADDDWAIDHLRW